MDELQPLAEETLGQYLARLRNLAGEVQHRHFSLEMIAERSNQWPPPQNFSPGWLNKVEADAYDTVSGDKLRVLASIYSTLARRVIPAEYLLAKAGFLVEEPGQISARWLEVLRRDERLRALVVMVARLIELGEEVDVRALLTIAEQYLQMRDPEAKGDEFVQRPLSDYVRQHLERLNL